MVELEVQSICIPSKWDYIDITDDLWKKMAGFSYVYLWAKEGRVMIGLVLWIWNSLLKNKIRTKEYCFEINVEMLGLQKTL